MKHTILKRAALVFILASLCAAAFIMGRSGAQPGALQEKAAYRPALETIVDTETIKVTAQGRHTTVYDLAGDAQYNFTTRVKRKTIGQPVPRTAADTETIRITLEGCQIQVKDKTTGTIYTIRRAPRWMKK